MSTNTNSTIFEGTWINWSAGPIYGATITLSPGGSSILLAVLALFIQFIGTRSWSIFCFAVHQFYSTRRPENGAYHQLQATLRNNSSDWATAGEVAKIAWFWAMWQSPLSKTFRAAFSVIFIGILHSGLFTAASLLSFHLTTVGNEVLVRSTHCGAWRPSLNGNNTDFIQVIFDQGFHPADNIDLAESYFLSCLLGKPTAQDCKLFKTMKMPYSTTYGVPCPFSEEMCLGAINSSVTFDTGFIDSSNHLGINALAKDRIELRKRMTCSPIATNGFLQNTSATLENGHTINFTAIQYGPNKPPLEITGVVSEVVGNSTDIIQGMDLDFVGTPGYQYYSFRTNTAYAYNNIETGFSAIPALKTPSSDMTLMFFSYAGFYTSPSDDLLFPAHVPITFESFSQDGTAQNTTQYSADKTVNVLGCTEQHQICNPTQKSDTGHRCVPLQGYSTIPVTDEALSLIFDNQNQIKTASFILNDILGLTTLDYLIRTIRHVPLLAARKQIQTVSSPLADDQWIQESNHLFALTLNIIQRYVTEFATGPPAPYTHYTDGYVAANPAKAFLCDSQIIRNSTVTNFSGLSIGLIFGIGALIIAASWNLPTIAGYVQRRTGVGLYRQVRWQMDATLQLQRMAFEAVGLGRWEVGTKSLPLTSEKEEKMQLPDEWYEESGINMLSTKGRTWTR